MAKGVAALCFTLNVIDVIPPRKLEEEKNT